MSARDHLGPLSRTAARRPWLPVAILLACLALLSAEFASAADERTLTFHNMHTGEDTIVTYWRNGRYVPEGLAQFNYAFRDWRRNETTEMDPRLIDLLWEVYRQTGSTGPINIISGYRSPTTNAMLRSQSTGVAQNSQHMYGNAIDIQIPGVDLTALRNIAMRMQIGGVGFYPTSGWPFVHIDTGSVRHWPALTRTELASIFPDGRTLYIPSNGVPLSGYAEAQAAYQARGDEVVALFGEPETQQPTRLAALFGGGNEPAAAPEPAPAAAPEPVVVAAALSPTLIVAPPDPRPTAGITVSTPPATVEALAFAPATDAGHDPLAILNEALPALTTAALTTVAPPAPLVAAAPIARRWYDPIAALSPPSLAGTGLPFVLATATTRQAAFAELTAPDISGSPQFLAKPDRVIAVGFAPDATGASHRFALNEPAPLPTIDLTRLATVAQVR